MRTRELGRSGLRVSAIGLGCMGMSEFYGPTSEAESLAALERAIELGSTFWDTADAYGTGKNEELLARALRGGQRQKVTLATKFGNVRDESGAFLGISGRPDYVRKAAEASLRRLEWRLNEKRARRRSRDWHTEDPAIALLEDSIQTLTEERNRIEERFRERARREGALPGWIR